MKLLEYILRESEIQDYILENEDSAFEYLKENFNINNIYDFVISNIKEFIVEDDIESSFNNIKNFALYETWFGTLLNGLKAPVAITADLSATLGISQISNKMISSLSQLVFDSASLLGSATDLAATSSILTKPMQVISTYGATVTAEIGLVSGMTASACVTSAAFVGYSAGNVMNQIPGFQDHVMKFVMSDVSPSDNGIKDTGLGLGWNLHKLKSAYDWADNKVQTGATNIYDYAVSKTSDRIETVSNLVSKFKSSVINSNSTIHQIKLPSNINVNNFNKNFENMSFGLINYADDKNNSNFLNTLSNFKSNSIPIKFINKIETNFNNLNLPEPARSTWDNIKELAYQYPHYYIPIITLGICGLIVKYKLKRKLSATPPFA